MTSREPRPLLASALACLSLTGCGGSEAGGPPHVLLLSVDSLRQDHASAYGRRGVHGEPTTPAFDALAERGVLFENARSTTSWTLPSHMALFTGLPDPLHGVVDNRRRLAPELVTLTELFADAGYATGGFFSGPNLHPTFGFARGFDEYVDCSQVRMPAAALGDPADSEPGAFVDVHTDSHAAVTSPTLVEAAGRYARTVLGRGEPLFLFVHWWDPHYDYLAPAAYVQRFNSGDYRGRFTGNHGIERKWAAEARDAQHLRELYDAEIRYTDDEIAGLLEVFEQEGVLDHTIVVYGSDHGEDFYEHDRWGHQRNLFETSVRIPLAMAGPGLPGGVRARGNAQLHDVFATLANLCGVELPGYVEARDLAPLWEDPTAAGPPSTLHLAVPMRGIELTALVQDERKALYDHRASTLSVFDLASDPLERRGVPAEQSDAAGRAAAEALVRELERLERAKLTLPNAGSAELDSALLDALEAMGYSVEPEDGDR